MSRYTREDVARYHHVYVARNIAGWGALVTTHVMVVLLEAIGAGATDEQIEREVTLWYTRKHPIRLNRSRLPRSGAKLVQKLATTARLAGLEPPTTFGDLLRLLIRLGIVADHGGRYSIQFPPPTPEETLPLTPELRADVLSWRRDTEQHTRRMETLEEAVRAEGPAFVPPAWMMEVLAQKRGPRAAADPSNVNP